MRAAFDEPWNGFFFLGGLTLAQLDLAENMLETFWQRYSYCDPYCTPAFPRRTIPIMLHGDEGRGQVQRPLLVVSYQPLLGSAGPNIVNSHQNLSCR